VRQSCRHARHFGVEEPEPDEPLEPEPELPPDPEPLEPPLSLLAGAAGVDTGVDVDELLDEAPSPPPFLGVEE
jgi:hypothetical protein